MKGDLTKNVSKFGFNKHHIKCRMTKVKEKKIALTVGSTQFSDLVLHFLSVPTLDALDASFSGASVLAQIGESAIPPAFHLGSQSYKSLALSVVKFLPDIEAQVAQADLVISHAGAGSILSFLRPSKALATSTPAARHLVLVPNSSLMDSHQADLAEEMSEKRWAIVSSPQALAESLRGLSSKASSSSTCPPFDPLKVTSILDETLGFV